MKFVHTADWHLGALLRGVHLTNDQSAVLFQLLDLVKDERPDFLFVTGDVFDRAVPPPEAVALLDEVLSRLLLDLRTRVVIIAGNHDSPRRLAFGSRILKSAGLHVIGMPTARPEIIPWQSGDERWEIVSLPFIEPVEARALFPDAGIADHQTAHRVLIDTIPVPESGVNRLLLGHAFVVGGQVGESERPLSVGGTGAVGADLFAGFRFAALGHLHRRQTLADGRVHYSGALMPYSFAEAGQEKSVTIGQTDPSGTVALRHVPLPAPHALRRMSGRFQEILDQAPHAPCRDDYLSIELADTGPILDAMGRLREWYPNLLQIERPAFEDRNRDPSGPVENPRGKTEVELFKAFYEHLYGNPLDPQDETLFASTIEPLRRRAEASE